MGEVTAELPELLPPEQLLQRHDLARFSNGRHALLDEWLRERARPSEGLSSRTYVVCPTAESDRVVGYFTISTALESRAVLPSAKLRRGMPDGVPLLLIGRLAVDSEWQGRGVGSMLLKNAMERCLAVARIAGVRAIAVHAIDGAATAFYEKHGFIGSPLGTRLLVLPIEAARALLKP